jgi:hypothetical protein
MFKTALTAITLAIAAVNSAHADPTLFEQGQRDRASWEQWFNGLQGDYKTGAFYWSSQRSTPHPGTCQQMNADFYAGCTAAKVKLAPSDALRKTEPDYKAGWTASITAPAAPFYASPASSPGCGKLRSS